MIRLHASYGLKVPAAQEYSSQSYHASVEIEVPDTALKDGIPATLSSLWHELRGAVEQQLAGNQAKPCVNGNHNGNGRQPANGGLMSPPQPSNTANMPTQGEPATKKQVNYLLSCAKRFRSLNMDQTREWLASQHRTSLEALTKTQAGQIIDELTGKAGAR